MPCSFMAPHVLGVVAYAEQAAMDRRVQRLHAAVHDFREAGHARHVAHGNAGRRERLRGAARRDQVDPPLVQGSGELDEAGLV